MTIIDFEKNSLVNPILSIRFWNVILIRINGSNYFVAGGGRYGVVLVGEVAGGEVGGEVGNIWIKPPPVEPVEVPGNTGIFTHSLFVVITIPTGQLPSEFF